jgi:hypothetical protein
VTLEEQAKNLQASLRQLERTRQQRWTTADDKNAVRATLKARIAEAERTLRLPATPETAHGRRELILWTELAQATLKRPEYQ